MTLTKCDSRTRNRDSGRVGTKEINFFANFILIFCHSVSHRSDQRIVLIKGVPRCTCGGVLRGASVVS